MGGSSKQTSNQNQTVKTSPWGPAQPLLQGLLGALGNQLANYGPSNMENQAYSQIFRNYQGLPDYGGQAQSIAERMMGGGSDALNNAYSTYESWAKPYLSADYLDPSTNPALSNVLATIKSDVGNQVNSMFAGAGRDLSGKNVQALSRGLSQGLAQPMFNQYNQNVAAQQAAGSGLLGAAQSTDAQRFANMLKGLDVGTQGIAAARNAGPMGLLQASMMQRMGPLQILGLLTGMGVPIAGLGGTKVGQGSSTTQTQYPWYSFLPAVSSLWNRP